jgi:hypothetical protein
MRFGRAQQKIWRGALFFPPAHNLVAQISESEISHPVTPCALAKLATRSLIHTYGRSWMAGPAIHERPYVCIHMWEISLIIYTYVYICIHPDNTDPTSAFCTIFLCAQIRFGEKAPAIHVSSYYIFVCTDQIWRGSAPRYASRAGEAHTFFCVYRSDLAGKRTPLRLARWRSLRLCMAPPLSLPSHTLVA